MNLSAVASFTSGRGARSKIELTLLGEAIHDRKHLTAQGAGHYGIFSGRRWREMVYPVVKQFILDHALKTAAPTQSAASAAAQVAAAAPAVTETVTAAVAETAKPAPKKPAATKASAPKRGADTAAAASSPAEVAPEGTPPSKPSEPEQAA